MRPELSKDTDAEVFLSNYYLKEELTAFCRNNGIPSTGSKESLTDRIAHFLSAGEIRHETPVKRKVHSIASITEDSLIEENIVCSEIHRAFFTEHIGKTFSFKVAFQRWLRENSGRTYADAIDAWYRIRAEKKNTKRTIGHQFEYNTYIRDFFSDNPGRTLTEAIQCWNFKKEKSGRHCYERSDTDILP